MKNTGAQSPSTVAKYDLGGVIDFANLDNVKVSDGTYATATTSSQFYNGIVGSDFGFSIPSDATITGIKLEIEAKVSTGTEVLYGVIATNGFAKVEEAAGSPSVSTSEQYIVFGGDSDLWGNTWTAADFNNSGFMAGLTDDGIATTRTYSIDHIRCTVYYTDAVRTYPSVFINDEEVTTRIPWQSLRVENLLTSQVDRCTFTIRNYENHTYLPIVGRGVEVTDNGTTIFAGVIVRVTEKSPTYGIVEYDVECSDFTRILDQHLVAETYRNMSIEDIITDIITDYAPAGFTTTQVSCSTVLDYIQFKYESVSSCLRQLAEMVGFDWYVDYDKDIFFQNPKENLAPFDIEDTTGTYVNETLVIRHDNSQVRNSIIVRGGEYLGNTFTAVQVADGQQTTFNLPYKYTDFGATLTGQPLKVGTDNLDDEDNYDALYNYQEKVLKFKESDRPRLGATLSFWGKPHLPVIVKYKDQKRIDAMYSAEGEGDGKYEYLVIDKSINSKQGARDRAKAEIKTYGDTLSEGEFVTETAGLRAGQTITINSTLHGVNEDFVINRVTSSMQTPGKLIYSISLITTKTMDFIYVMKKLLMAENKKIEINDNETLDLVEAADEDMTLTEVTVASISHHPSDETMTLTESFTPQALNYAVEFVMGPTAPTGTKRQFILGGSPLA